MRREPMIVLTVLFVLAGCQREPTDEEMKQQVFNDLMQGVDQWQQQQQALQAQQQAQQQVVAGAGDIAALQLVSPGAGPARPLRYAFEPGDLGRIQVDVNLQTPNTRGRGPKDIILPTVRYLLALKGEAVADGTGFRVSFNITDVDVLNRKGVLGPQLVEHLRPSVEKMRPFAGSVVIDDRGFTRQTAVPPLPGAQQENKQAYDMLLALVRQLVPPLPAEPVGTGASWTASRTIKTFELTAQEQVTYTVQELAEQGGRLTVQVTRSANAQPWAAPSDSPATVVSYSFTASGTRDFQFRSPVPVVRLNSQSSRSLLGVGDSAPMVVPMVGELIVGPAK